MARVGVAVAGSVVLGALLASVGCGSGGDSTFGASGGSSGDNLTSSGSLGSSGGGDHTGTSGGTSGASGGVGTVGNVDPTSACATSNAGVDAPPVYLVFMIDRSGSMDVPERWVPVKTGLEAFFADPANSNVHASMAFFSQGDISKNSSPGCQAAAYTTPSVPMSALPDATTFSAAFTAIGTPSGGTPTLPAELGAIAYAQTVQAGLKPGEKVAIVLATDGEPNNCSSTAANVATAAGTVAATIPTYVIGVGTSPGLDTIAAGGGTGKAIIVNVASAANVSADLRKAVNTIKAAQLGCEYTLPAPPAGQTLDVNAVNVNYTPAGGASKTLAYSADCSNADGWHYDSTTAPTQIIMCTNACNTLKADTGGKLDIIFGCAIAAPPGTMLPGGGVK